MKHYEVVAAVIVHNGKILCVQKGTGKRAYDAMKYEFAGGKIEAGETEEEAVVREIREELDMEVVPERKLIMTEYQYPDMHISMHVWLCSCENPQVTLLEHIAFKWLLPSELRVLDWAPAEWPVVEIVEGMTF